MQNHPGNVSFREFVSGRKRDYIFAEKNEKTKISSSVYEEIKNQYPPVMFLEQDKNTLLWKEVEKKKAVSKIGQALRENAKEFKDKLDQKPAKKVTIEERTNQIKSQPEFISTSKQEPTREVAALGSEDCLNLSLKSFDINSADILGAEDLRDVLNSDDSFNFARAMPARTANTSIKQSLSVPYEPNEQPMKNPGIKNEISLKLDQIMAELNGESERFKEAKESLSSEVDNIASREHLMQRQQGFAVRTKSTLERENESLKGFITAVKEKSSTSMSVEDMGDFNISSLSMDFNSAMSLMDTDNISRQKGFSVRDLERENSYLKEIVSALKGEKSSTSLMLNRQNDFNVSALSMDFNSSMSISGVSTSDLSDEKKH